jgi:hypothetical protein
MIENRGQMTEDSEFGSGNAECGMKGQRLECGRRKVRLQAQGGGRRREAQS